MEALDRSGCLDQMPNELSGPHHCIESGPYVARAASRLRPRVASAEASGPAAVQVCPELSNELLVPYSYHRAKPVIDVCPAWPTHPFETLPMASDKKHRSLKSLFGHSSPSSAQMLPLLSTSHHHDHAVGSHRFFLRRRNSHSSITPQSSAGSIRSAAASGSNSELGSAASTHSANHSDSEHSQSALVVRHGDGARRKKDKKKNGSHHLLKRFFKILRSHESLAKAPQLPLEHTSQLAAKYDLGRLIGAGASGSVNLVTDKHDALKIYAVKKFRAKLRNESEHDYVTKVKNEFLVGDYLLHQNLIHTIELVREAPPAGPEYYIVMEYCPYDFFNLVMSGLMRREEIYCYIKQIISGVHHLHSSGVAHRDLKLDNCVVDANGVLKLIDFGSAVQFRKLSDPTAKNEIKLDDDHKLVLAKGIVGSDPYLSPEVFECTSESGYDPRLADIWSIAIIFCCMVLKRFPWKVPRIADPSYRSFADTSAPEILKDDDDVSKLEKDTGALHMKELPKSGPDRLLKLLPTKLRPLIRGMLEVETSKRFFIEDVVADPFFHSIHHCHYLEESEVAPSSPATTNVDGSPVTANTDGLPATTFDGAPLVVSANEALNNGTPNPVHIESTHDFENGSPGRATTLDTSQSVSSEITAVNPRTHLLGSFIRALNHEHHLITESELAHINEERERARKLKEGGIA